MNLNPMTYSPESTTKLPLTLAGGGLGKRGPEGTPRGPPSCSTPPVQGSELRPCCPKGPSAEPRAFTCALTERGAVLAPSANYSRVPAVMSQPLIKRSWHQSRGQQQQWLRGAEGFGAGCWIFSPCILAGRIDAVPCRTGHRLPPLPPLPGLQGTAQPPPIWGPSSAACPVPQQSLGET